MSAQWGVCPGGVADPLPVNRVIDRCKNIAATSLQALIIV